ncbi:MAG: hypothetical protein WC966_02710 [Bradymonadales bacterium]|jgi:hypothetical protein
MQRSIWLFLSLAIFSVACTTTHTPPPSVATHKNMEKGADKSGEAELHEPISIATHCHWPELLPNGEFPQVLSVVSGTDDGVWAEAKGYLFMPLEDVVARFKIADVVAPVHMTDNYTLENYRESDGVTEFDLRLVVKYILSVEFVLTWSIEPFKENGNPAYEIIAYKSSGTKHISEISHHILLRKLEDNLSSIELRSVTRAAMDKEEESREYVEGLFERILNR